MVSFDGKGAYEPRFGFNLESLLEVVFSEPVCHDEKSTLECARILLKHGARIDGLDSNGMAALLDHCYQAPLARCRKELLGHGANPLARGPSTPFSKTAFGWAHNKRAFKPFELCLNAIESRGIAWEREQWEMLRNQVERPKSSAKLFDFETIEPWSGQTLRISKLRPNGMSLSCGRQSLATAGASRASSEAWQAAFCFLDLR
jgi:hypothetical protein